MWIRRKTGRVFLLMILLFNVLKKIQIYLFTEKIDVISVFESHDSVAALWKGITQLTVIG